MRGTLLDQNTLYGWCSGTDSRKRMPSGVASALERDCAREVLSRINLQIVRMSLQSFASDASNSSSCSLAISE